MAAQLVMPVLAEVCNDRQFDWASQPSSEVKKSGSRHHGKRT